MAPIRFGVRVADFSQVTPFDIEEGRNVLETPFGDLPMATSCGYVVVAGFLASVV